MSVKFHIAFAESATIKGGLAIQLKLSGDAAAAAAGDRRRLARYCGGPLRWRGIIASAR